MANELLIDLKSRLKDVNCTDLLENPVIDRLVDSTSIANKDSHDSYAVMEFGDLKSHWQDVQDFEKLFFCEACSTHVSTKFAASGDNKVQCKEGHLSYSWKS